MQPHNTQYDIRNDRDTRNRTNWSGKEFQTDRRDRDDREDRDDRWETQVESEQEEWGHRGMRSNDSGERSREREFPAQQSDRARSGYGARRNNSPLDTDNTGRSRSANYYGEQNSPDRYRVEQQRGAEDYSTRGPRYSEYEFGTSPFSRNEQDREVNQRYNQAYDDDQRFPFQLSGEAQSYRGAQQYGGQRNYGEEARQLSDAMQSRDTQQYSGQSGANSGMQRTNTGVDRDLRSMGGSTGRSPFPSFRGFGPQGYTRSDERITDDINERLTDDHQVDARNIDVRVSKGSVTLTGRVSDRAMKYRAEEIAERISGVKEVENQIKVAKADDKKAEDKDKPDQGAAGEHDQPSQKGRTVSSSTGAATNKPSS